METVMWIFNNVMPWVGVYFTVATIIFFGFFVNKVLKVRGIRHIHSHYDITEDAIDVSGIVNAIPLFLINLISWLGEKIIMKSKAIKAMKMEKSMKCKEGNCGGDLATENQLSVEIIAGAKKVDVLFCKRCRRLHHRTGGVTLLSFNGSSRGSISP